MSTIFETKEKSREKEMSYDTGYRPEPSPKPPPKKPGVDPEARKEWLGALRAVQGIKPPEELPPLQRAWVQMYCAALRGEYATEYAARAADYGVERLTENSDAAQLTRLPLPDYTEMLKLITDAMSSHIRWEDYVVGTPLENDLPVRAANVAMERLRK